LSAWLLWLLVHIFYLVGFRNRILVIAQWGWAYLRNERGARLITGRIESPFQLKPLYPLGVQEETVHKSVTDRAGAIERLRTDEETKVQR